MKLFLILALCVLGALAQSRTFQGYKVLRITPHTKEQFTRLRGLNNEFHDMLDFWMDGPIGHPTDVMVPPQLVDMVTDILIETSMEYTIHNDNIQQLLDEETMESAGKPGGKAFNYNVYHDHQEIMDWMTDFRNQHAGSSNLIISEFELPSRSYEGRPIKIMKMSTGSGRKGAFTQGGIHAREWVSPATIINLIRQFVEAYEDGDSAVVNFFNKFDWYVVPVLNVDGYQYTRPSSSPRDRMWRKNRQVNPGYSCVGIDMNRNYGYRWDQSYNRCSETYTGTSAYSAVELATLTNYLTGLRNGGQQFDIFVDVHSYAQYWVYPYSYCYSFQATVGNLAELRNVAILSTEALRQPFNTPYTIMTSGDWYPAAGTSEDFGYETLGARFSYTVELRDDGRYGFLLPERYIEPTGIETFHGFRAFFNHVASL